MQAETLAAIETIKSAIDLLRKHVGWDTALGRAAALEAQISSPNFWSSQENAQRVMREKTHLDQQIAAIKELETELQDQMDLIQLAEEENDIELVDEANAELARLAEIAGKKQLESLLSGEADGNNCFIEIHPGAKIGKTPEGAQGQSHRIEKTVGKVPAQRGVRAEESSFLESS